MSKKISSLLCLLISAMLLVTAMPVSAGFYGSDEVNALVFDFESDADYTKVLQSGKDMYELVEGIGADGSNGSLKVSVNDRQGLDTFTGGVASVKPIFKNGVTYKISYKVMADESTVGATFRTAFIAENASGAYTNIGNKTDVAVGDTYSNMNPWWMHDPTTIPCDGAWHTYEQVITMGDDVFGLGSSSKVSVTSHDKIHFYLRYYAETDNGLYVDDIIVEPVSKSTDFVKTLALGDEVMGFTAPNQVYNAYFVNNANLMKRTGYNVSMTDTNNFVQRALANVAGKDGGPAYVGAFTPQNGGYGAFGFANQAYNFGGIKPNGFYQVRARVKAPAVTVNTDIATETGKYWIDQSGNVYVMDETTTNGIIGASLGFQIKIGSKEFNGAFAGRLDGNGNYMALNPADVVATTDWRTYIGYIYIDESVDFTVAGSDSLWFNFTGATGDGLYMIDQFSIKPVNEENLVANGWLNAYAQGRNYNGVEKCNAPFVYTKAENVDNATMAKMDNGFYTYMGNGESKEYTLGVRKLKAGVQYSLNAEMMSNDGKINAVTLSLTNGTVTQTITPEPVIINNNNSWSKLSYTFTPSAELLGDGTISPDLIINVGPSSEGTSGSFRIKYAEIIEPFAYAASNIAVSGDLEVGKNITVSWTDISASGMADGFLVKMYCDGMLLGATATATTSASITVPEAAYGKALSFEVIAYKDNVAYFSTTYTTADVVFRPLAEITNASLNNGEYGAVVTNNSGAMCDVIIATYAADGSMLLVSIVPLPTGESVPISISAADAAFVRIFVFDELGFGGLTPLCEKVEF